jgi:hypothetical protein
LVGASTGPTVGYWLDNANDNYPYESSWWLQRPTSGAVGATFGSNEVGGLVIC